MRVKWSGLDIVWEGEQNTDETVEPLSTESSDSKERQCQREKVIKRRPIWGS